MSAQEYPQLAVQPIVAEFEQDQASVRRAFLASVAAYHMIEYMDPKDLQRHRQRFRKESAAFAWVDRVAHTFKHVGCDGLQRLEASSVYSSSSYGRGLHLRPIDAWRHTGAVLSMVN